MHIGPTTPAPMLIKNHQSKHLNNLIYNNTELKTTGKL